jgi:hypothetical protein
VSVLDVLKGKYLRGFGLVDTGLDSLENLRKRDLREWKFWRSHHERAREDTTACAARLREAPLARSRRACGAIWMIRPAR